MKATIQTSLLALTLALMGGCAITVAVVPTSKGTYRFYNPPFGANTEVEMCTNTAPVSCKKVAITYE